MIPRRSRTDRADESAGRFSLSGNLLRATAGHINRRATCRSGSPFGRFRPPWTGIRPSEANRETGRSTNVPRRERPTTAGRTVRLSRKKGSPSTDEAAERRPAFSPPPQRASPLRMPQGLFPAPHAPVPKEPVPDRPPVLAYEPHSEQMRRHAPTPLRYPQLPDHPCREHSCRHPPGIACPGKHGTPTAKPKEAIRTKRHVSERSLSLRTASTSGRTAAARPLRRHFRPSRPVFLRGGIRCRGCRTGIPPSRIRA